MTSLAADTIPPDPVLLPLQERAVARLAYASARPGTWAVLCGPPGTGKSLVLAAVAAASRAAGRSCEVIPWRDVEHRPADAWPDAILLDDVDAADEGALAAFVGTHRAVRPRSSVVLAGCGRLLTLVARDRRLERSVRLRAILGPCARSETRALVEGVLAAALSADASAVAVCDAIHEIGGGIPADVVRLAELAMIVATDERHRPLTPDVIEQIHTRLAVTAA